MKKIARCILGAVLAAALLFAEYRFIMVNIHPYCDSSGTVYLELFGCIDEYQADYIGN